MNSSSQIPGGSYQDYSVFIGDLPFEATDESILNLFKDRYSSLTGCRIARDGHGRSKGIGFVRFSERADQLRAVEEMNGCTLFGRKLRMEESVKAPLPPGQVPEKKGRDRDRSRGGGGGVEKVAVVVVVEEEEVVEVIIRFLYNISREITRNINNKCSNKCLFTLIPISSSSNNNREEE